MVAVKQIKLRIKVKKYTLTQHFKQNKGKMNYLLEVYKE